VIDLTLRTDSYGKADLLSGTAVKADGRVGFESFLPANDAPVARDAPPRDSRSERVSSTRATDADSTRTRRDASADRAERAAADRSAADRALSADKASRAEQVAADNAAAKSDAAEKAREAAAAVRDANARGVTALQEEDATRSVAEQDGKTRAAAADKASKTAHDAPVKETNATAAETGTVADDTAATGNDANGKTDAPVVTAPVVESAPTETVADADGDVAAPTEGAETVGDSDATASSEDDNAETVAAATTPEATVVGAVGPTPSVTGADATDVTGTDADAEAVDAATAPSGDDDAAPESDGTAEVNALLAQLIEQLQTLAGGEATAPAEGEAPTTEDLIATLTTLLDKIDAQSAGSATDRQVIGADVRRLQQGLNAVVQNGDLPELIALAGRTGNPTAAAVTGAVENTTASGAQARTATGAVATDLATAGASATVPADGKADEAKLGNLLASLRRIAGDAANSETAVKTATLTTSQTTQAQATQAQATQAQATQATATQAQAAQAPGVQVRAAQKPAATAPATESATNTDADGPTTNTIVNKAAVTATNREAAPQTGTSGQQASSETADTTRPTIGGTASATAAETAVAAKTAAGTQSSTATSAAQTAAKTAATAQAAAAPVTADTPMPAGVKDFGDSLILLQSEFKPGSESMLAQARPSVTVPRGMPLATGVAAEIARFATRGDSRFEIRLDPPELGRVDVKLKVSDDGTVRAHLVVERSETLDMFTRDQRSLERTLEQAGLKTDSGSLEFSLRSGNDDTPQQDGNGGRGLASSEGDADAVEVERMSAVYSSARADGRLDIRV